MSGARAHKKEQGPRRAALAFVHDFEVFSLSGIALD
jgi:hypothetical protein